MIYATFIRAHNDRYFMDITQFKGLVSHIDADPYNYLVISKRWMAEHCGYKLMYISNRGTHATNT